METLTRKTWPGSTGLYSTQPDTDTLAQILTPVKSRKPRPRVDRRAYPEHIEGESTRDYVERYFKLNSARDISWNTPVDRSGPCVFAHPDHIDHLALYHHLSTAPQYTPANPIEETIE